MPSASPSPFRPPFPRTRALFRRARATAKGLGIPCFEAVRRFSQQVGKTALPSADCQVEPGFLA